jgi:sulfide dehydrogenase cytochrome subunit
MKLRRLLICLLSLSWGGVALADVPEPVQAQCARCHGLDGLAMASGQPHLNGQLSAYLVDAMQKYQKGRLPTAVANHIPATLDADALAAIADHYAGSKAVRPKQQTDPDKVAKGAEIYRIRCLDCHGDNGREADNGAPLMAAQNLDYMLAQTRAFVGGQRKFGFLQDDAFKGLSAEELDAVANFFADQEQYAAKSGGAKKKRR